MPTLAPTFKHAIKRHNHIHRRRVNGGLKLPYDLRRSSSSYRDVAPLKNQGV